MVRHHEYFAIRRKIQPYFLDFCFRQQSVHLLPWAGIRGEDSDDGQAATTVFVFGYAPCRIPVMPTKKKGLYANIHAKRKRIAKGSSEKMRKPGQKGAPAKTAFRKSARTAKKR